VPLYEYKCKACGHRLEKIVMFSDPPLTLCPHCGKESLEQLISASSVHFKGSGWYKTDYASKSTGSDVSASSSGKDGVGSSAVKPAASSSDSASSAKTETKSEAKTESKPAAASSAGGEKK